MSQPAGLLAIGRFAQLTRLSAKQLRRYDELGLLAPAVVDPDSGYRFYHPRQARTAATIALLRELDVPLGVVRELLVADEERAAALLAAERERRAAELERVARAVATLGRLAGDGALPDVTVRVREEPARTLAWCAGPPTPSGWSRSRGSSPTGSPASCPTRPRRSPRCSRSTWPTPSTSSSASRPPRRSPGPSSSRSTEDRPPPPCTTGPATRSRSPGGRCWPGCTSAGSRPRPLRERYLDAHLTHLTVPLEGAP
jgi:DNA-binding transcriptional MerR regulator